MDLMFPNRTVMKLILTSEHAFSKGVDMFIRVEGLIVDGGLYSRFSAVHFRPDTKSGGRGGCVCVCCTLQAQYKRRGGGCLVEEGEVP